MHNSVCTGFHCKRLSVWTQFLFTYNSWSRRKIKYFGFLHSIFRLSILETKCQWHPATRLNLSSLWPHQMEESLWQMSNSQTWATCRRRRGASAWRAWRSDNRLTRPTASSKLEPHSKPRKGTSSMAAMSKMHLTAFQYAQKGQLVSRQCHR